MAWLETLSKSPQCTAVLFMNLSTAKWNSLFHKTRLESQQIEVDDETCSCTVRFHSDRPNRTFVVHLQIPIPSSAISVSGRIARGMRKWIKGNERLREVCVWGGGGYMFVSCHTLCLISLSCSAREWQELWTVLMWCQHRLCFCSGRLCVGWMGERDRKLQTEKERAWEVQKTAWKKREEKKRKTDGARQMRRQEKGFGENTVAWFRNI